MKYSYMAATEEIAGTHLTGLKGEYDDTFRLIKSAGFQGVELMMKNPFRVNFGKVEQYLKKYHLELSVICTGEMYGEDHIGLGLKDKETRLEAIRRLKELMNFAGAHQTHVTLGRSRGMYEAGVAKEDTEKWAMEGLMECASSNENVNLLIEPINHFYQNFILSTEEGVQFVQKLNIKNVRLMLDYIHMVIEGEDVLQSLERAFSYCDHIHVCDSDRLPLGMGQFDFTPFAKKLAEKGYQRYLSVEPFDTEDYKADVFGSFAVLDKVFGRQL